MSEVFDPTRKNLKYLGLEERLRNNMSFILENCMVEKVASTYDERIMSMEEQAELRRRWDDKYKVVEPFLRDAAKLLFNDFRKKDTSKFLKIYDAICDGRRQEAADILTQLMTDSVEKELIMPRESDTYHDETIHHDPAEMDRRKWMKKVAKAGVAAGAVGMLASGASLANELSKEYDESSTAKQVASIVSLLASSALAVVSFAANDTLTEDIKREEERQSRTESTNKNRARRVINEDVVDKIVAATAVMMIMGKQKYAINFNVEAMLEHRGRINTPHSNYLARD